ncbi:MAG: ComEC/Rec2 family competence protein, partial [Planctomycetota bacterium]
VRMGPQIGATSLLLILIDPAIVFDIGAWLSFLAVGALGWVTELRTAPESRPLPPDEVTWYDRIREWWHFLLQNAEMSYRQMLAVTLLSAPVVATQFHVVSLVGMVINILLIPFTTLTLIAGYLLVFIGLLIPPMAFVPAAIFDVCLSVLNGAVSVSADLPYGFVTLPDLPGWFLPVYYGLLGLSAIAVRSVVQQSLRLLLLLLVMLTFWNADTSPRPGELVCTTLSVGHGNAIVVETPGGRVLLFDAGALNRAERTADIVCRFLWHRGYRMLDAIVISHPDADHYNAVQSLLDRMPVGQVMLTTEFARAESPEVQAVVSAMADSRIPVSVVMHDDHFELEDCRFNFFKASPQPESEMSDNSSSLVCFVTYQGRRICLPGDLEGDGQQQLLSSLPECDLLVSPHHGSPASNTAGFSQTLAPTDVFVSARDHERRVQLEQIFPRAAIHFTSEVGALMYRISENGQANVQAFRTKIR